MTKISALPTDTAPTGTDYVPTVDTETGTTKRILLSTLAAYIYSNNPYPTEGRSDFVASGGIWSGDSVGVNRNASMTALVVNINGRRISISVVTARNFTASKDTYVDVLDNTDGTGTLVYTEVANNAASPSLAANSIRIATVVTGATTIAASTSIGQGGFANTSPSISSQILKGFDTLGNIIYPKGPVTSAKAIVPYKFSVYRAAAYNTFGSFTVFPFDTKLYDTGNNFDVTTNKGRFTAPVAGYYWFSATVGQNAAVGTQQGLQLWKNGSSIKQGPTNMNTTAGGTFHNIGAGVQLAAGDYVEVAHIGSGGGAASVGQASCWFDGELRNAS